MQRHESTRVGGNILWVRFIFFLVIMLGVFLLGQKTADKSADLQATIETQASEIAQLRSSTINKDAEIEQLRRRLVSIGGNLAGISNPSATQETLDSQGNVVQRIYVVQENDTLHSIAIATYGDVQFYYLIQQANNLSGQNTLRPGQKLIIPDKPAEDS